MNDIVKITPENLEVANAYIQYQSIESVSSVLGIPTDRVSEILETREVKKYIDNMYLNQGYRNRDKLGSLLDRIIESRLEEAAESGMYSNKDLADLLALAHKMRMDELEIQIKREKKDAPAVQINTNNPLLGGNYGKLMERLMGQGPVPIPVDGVVIIPKDEN